MLFDEGPRTALHSDQRVFSLKSTAALILATWNIQLATALSKDGSMILDQGRLLKAYSVSSRPRSGTGLCEAKTGQAKPDWPPKVTGF